MLKEMTKQVDKFNELQKIEANNFNTLKSKYIELEERYKQSEENNEKIQIKLDELIADRDKWKNKTLNFISRLKKLDILNEDKIENFINNYKDQINGHCTCCNCKGGNIVEPIKVEDDPLYINLKNNNEKLNKQVQELNYKDDSLLNEKINEAVGIALEKQKVKYENNYNSLKKEFDNFKNNSIKQDLPLTPSNSNDIKQEKKKNKVIHLPVNLLLVVYNRSFKIDKTKHVIIKENNNLYLKCCNNIYNNLVLNKDNYITCNDCFVSYKLDNNNKLINTILNEHIIDKEKEILKSITCNNCNYIDKKEINICYKCKKIQDALIYEFKSPNKDDIGYEAKLLVAK